jgi:hypothetical protein
MPSLRPFASRLLPLSLLASTFLALPALAAPRDAVAVYNRCGKPLKGDEIIYENTVAGGRRILSYERGTLHFDRVGNDGWTFRFGTHRKLENLDAEQMEKYMPCLKDALADSAADAPIHELTEGQRVIYSAKLMYKKLVIYTLLGLVLLGIIFFIWSKQQSEEEEA